MHEPTDNFKSWLADLQAWRTERFIRIGYDDSQYHRPEFQWAQRNFIAPQVMVQDRYLYDPYKGQYTVDRYLKDLDNRYGELTAFLLGRSIPASESMIAICSTSTVICRAVFPGAGLFAHPLSSDGRLPAA